MKTKLMMKYGGMLLIIVAFIFSGCEDLLDSEVSPEDSTSAVAKVDSASDALEGLMTDVFNAEPDSVEQMLDLLDFSEPYGLYVEAHDLDPGNTDANFGMGFTGFMMLSQDTQLQEMLLRWEEYFKANEPFLVSEASTLGKNGYGLPMSIDGIRIPVLPLMQMPVALTKMSLGDVPQFSEFQSLVETLFLPVVEESIVALELVDDDSTYTYIISPAMQGEAEATPVELDLTEIYALEAGLYALKGVLKTVVAYNFDFVSFDSVGIVTELSQGSDFATLKSNGAADMGMALTSVNTAFDKVFLALDFLEAETDNQDDDLITFGVDDDPAEIRSDIAEVQSALQTSTVIHFSYFECTDWDQYGDCISEVEYDDSITVDISKFFNNPITDFKAMLPPYTMGTQLYYDHWNNYYTEYVSYTETSVSVPNLSNVPVSITLRLQAWEEDIQVTALVYLAGVPFDLTTAPTSAIPTAIWDLYARFDELVTEYSKDTYDYQYVSFTWSGNVTTGASLQIDGDIFVEFDELGNAYVEPHPTWNDTTYAEWLTSWPDPTMNGIFPGLDAQGLADLLDFTEEDWNYNNGN